MKNECYPSWRYHRCEAPKLVQSKAEDLALGKDWADSPAALEAKTCKPPAPLAEDELADVPAPTEPPVGATKENPAPSGEATEAPKEKSLEEMSAKELRALVEARGLKLPGNASKAVMIEALQGGGNA
jgi:hypothetical protein